MPTIKPICEGREGYCEGRCEGQDQRQYRLVKGVKGKTSCAYTYTPRATHPAHVHQRLHSPAYTRALHALHALHKSMVVRVSDVKGKSARPSRPSQEAA